MIVVERFTTLCNELKEKRRSISNAEQTLLHCQQDRVREEAKMLDFFRRWGTLKDKYPPLGIFMNT